MRSAIVAPSGTVTRPRTVVPWSSAIGGTVVVSPGRIVMPSTVLGRKPSAWAVSAHVPATALGIS